jgi:hypothetical protein
MPVIPGVCGAGAIAEFLEVAVIKYNYRNLK